MVPTDPRDIGATPNPELSTNSHEANTKIVLVLFRLGGLSCLQTLQLDGKRIEANGNLGLKGIDGRRIISAQQPGSTLQSRPLALHPTPANNVSSW